MEPTPRDREHPASDLRTLAAREPAARWRSFGFRAAGFIPISGFGFRVFFLAVLLVGCSSKDQTPQPRAEAARTLFERATKQFHLPSAEATGAEQRRLQEQAAAAYRELLRKYPDQEDWAAPALRSLANLRAAQTNLDEAVRLYSAVAEKYPRQEWEVLTAWKSAADLLWDAGRRAEAKAFYQRLVDRFDEPDAPAVVKTVVLGSQSRLVSRDRSEGG